MAHTRNRKDTTRIAKFEVDSEKKQLDKQKMLFAKYAPIINKLPEDLQNDTIALVTIIETAEHVLADVRRFQKKKGTPEGRAHMKVAASTFNRGKDLFRQYKDGKFLPYLEKVHQEMSELNRISWRDRGSTLKMRRETAKVQVREQDLETRAQIDTKDEDEIAKLTSGDEIILESALVQPTYASFTALVDRMTDTIILTKLKNQLPQNNVPAHKYRPLYVQQRISTLRFQQQIDRIDDLDELRKREEKIENPSWQSYVQRRILYLEKLNENDESEVPTSLNGIYQTEAENVLESFFKE